MFTGTVNIVILFDVCVPFGSVYNKVKLVAYVSINIVYSVHCKIFSGMDQQCPVLVLSSGTLPSVSRDSKPAPSPLHETCTHWRR